jgi:hypothetical protein
MTMTSDDYTCIPIDVDGDAMFVRWAGGDMTPEEVEILKEIGRRARLKVQLERDQQ